MNTLEQQTRWMGAAVREIEQLERRYAAACRQGRLAAAVGRALGRRTALLSLDELLGGRMAGAGRSVGLRSVPIARIVASEGRAGDFDRRFRPLQSHTWERWRSVAAALLAGAALPPVELLAVGDRYAVRDGHHRISAAAALGARDVDALVTRIGG